jgi:hypothetical protein
MTMAIKNPEKVQQNLGQTIVWNPDWGIGVKLRKSIRFSFTFCRNSSPKSPSLKKRRGLLVPRTYSPPSLSKRRGPGG